MMAAEGGGAPDPDRTAVARGETVGEAKWRAVRELRSRFPGLIAEDVGFEITEGEEAEGAGDVEVRAMVDVARWTDRSREFSLNEEPIERVRDAMTRIVDHLGLQASIRIEEGEEEATVSADGGDLGVLIGRRGKTLDAIQLVMARIASGDGEWRKRVVVDVGGYRDRRAATVRREAESAAERAVEQRRVVELEPMPAIERRTVHMHLAGRGDVVTHSEGDEPYRRIVVAPAAGL